MSKNKQEAPEASSLTMEPTGTAFDPSGTGGLLGAESNPQKGTEGKGELKPQRDQGDRGKSKPQKTEAFPKPVKPLTVEQYLQKAEWEGSITGLIRSLYGKQIMGEQEWHKTVTALLKKTVR